MEPVECPPGKYMPWGMNTTIVGEANHSIPTVSDHFLAGSGDPAKRQFECLDCPGG